MSFKGQVVIITGASAGIGATCAEYFAKEGALLALVGRNEERSKQVVQKIIESGIELEPLLILADISVDAERIIDETIEKYGRLDVLINNAAFAIPGTVENTRMEDFDQMFATNVRGTFILTQLAIPYLKESKGNVINISSICGVRTFEGLFGYCMTKSAVDQFTRCAAVDLAKDGVRVNAVNPGVFDTNFHGYLGVDKDTPEYMAAMDAYAQMHPLGRLGEPEECVDAIAFLAKNRFVTGINLSCDGGMNAKGPRYACCFGDTPE